MENNYLCVKCGKELSPHVLFCTECGTKVLSTSLDERSESIKSDFSKRKFQTNINKQTSNRNNDPIPYNQLKSILYDFEKKSGEKYENAKNKLIEYLPMEAVQPLYKIASKITIDNKRSIDALDILGQIGTDEVANLLTSGEYYDDEIKFHVIQQVVSIGSPSSLNWLISNSFNIPENLLVYSYLEKELPKDMILDFASKNIDLDFYEPDGGLVSRRIGFAIVEAIAKSAAQQETKKRELSILPFTKFFPVELIIGFPQMCHKSFSLYMKMIFLYQMCERYGLSILNNWEMYKASHNKKEISPYSDLLIASIYILSKKDNPIIPTAIMSVINTPTTGNASYLAKMFAYDLMVMHTKNSRNVELEQLISKGILNDKVFSNSIISSIFANSAEHLFIHVFNRFKNLNQNELNNLLIPIVFGKCVGISECIVYYDILKRGSSDTKESIELFEEIFSNIN